MKSISHDTISALLRNAEKWAVANPGREYRKILMIEGGEYSLVSDRMFDETCLPSQWVGEVFAVKEAGEPVYSSFNES